MFSELTSTPLVVWSFCWRYVVWTTSKLCIETTSFLVGSMSWVHQIITAAPLGIFAWSGIITAFEIQSLSSGDSIWTATILSKGTILVLTDENHPQQKLMFTSQISPSSSGHPSNSGPAAAFCRSGQQPNSVFSQESQTKTSSGQVKHPCFLGP